MFEKTDTVIQTQCPDILDNRLIYVKKIKISEFNSSIYNILQLCFRGAWIGVYIIFQENQSLLK